MRLAVFISGGGSNLKALIQAEKEKYFSSEIKLVVSNTKAKGLSHAKKAGIETLISKDEEEILEKLKEKDIDLIVLAGYLPKVKKTLIDEYKIINIHPSLLPKYGGKGCYGIHVHEKVFDAGEDISGVTVHWVNEKLDDGDTIIQRQVDIRDCKNPQEIAAKVLKEEHLILKKAIKKLEEKKMRALISLTDKTNVDYLAKNLERLGCEIISTGGTYKAIKDAGVEVKEIEEITNFPEILDGRVKTLSPYVHGGILYKRDDENHVKTVEDHDIKAIDIVCVNLYDFQKALKSKDYDLITENIDIGGPSMIRSAAKNHKDVLVLTDPADYEDFIERLENDKIDLSYRRKLAMKAYSLTAYYDSIIARYFQDFTGEQSAYKTYGFEKEADLRYGENPQQEAILLNDNYVEGLLKDCQVIHGKAMSFNNYNDLNVAVELAHELGENSCVALKHQSPCGVAIGDNVSDAYHKAYLADPLSIFGGIISINGVVDKATAEEMSEIFLEIVSARDFTEEALEVLTKKKNIRLVKINFDNKKVEEDIKYLNGKVLIQDKDEAVDEFNVVTDQNPTEDQIRDLKFAMTVVKHTKSNAIVIAKDLKTLGVGPGQTSRIWALEAIKNSHPDVDFTDSVMSSDAFFPFDDCVKLASSMGVKSIIQPGGSIRDKDSIDACNENSMSMVFTKNRHFKH